MVQDGGAEGEVSTTLQTALLTGEWRNAAVEKVLKDLRDKLMAKRMRLTSLFKKVDGSGNAISGSAEFRQGLAGLGIVTSDLHFQALMMKLDKDKAGHVKLTELDVLMKRVLKDPNLDLSRTAEKKEQSSQERTPQTARETRTLKHAATTGGAKLGSTLEREAMQSMHRRKPEVLENMTVCDEVLARIRGMLNRRKIRSIDLFKFLDTSGDGEMSKKELVKGLERLGVSGLGKEEIEAIMQSLDADKNGHISIAEFDTAIKLAEKKARAEGKDQLLDTWKVPSGLALDFDNKGPFNWNARMMKFDSELKSASLGLPAETSVPPPTSPRFNEQGSVSFTDISKTDGFLPGMGHSWQQSSTGPFHHAANAKIGCGNFQDGSILRQRLLDQTWASKPPTLETFRLPLYRHGTFKQMIADTRWGAEIGMIPHEGMLKGSSKAKCASAHRPRIQEPFALGKKQYRHCPAMQSEVDTVIFGKDLDASGDTKFNKEAMKKMFEGCHGIPTWMVRHPDSIDDLTQR